MAKILRFDPGQPSQRQSVNLDGDVYEVSVEWRERAGAWYMALRDASGSRIFESRRISPQSFATDGLLTDGGPPGAFLVRGAEHYRREALNRTLFVIYIEQADLAAPDDEDPLEVIRSEFLGADLSGVGTLTAALNRYRSVSGTLRGSGTLSASLVRERGLVGSLQGVGSVAATLSRERGLVATLSGSGTLSGSIVRERLISSTLSGAGTLTGTLTRERTLAASLSGVGSVSGALVRERGLSATLQGIGDIDARLSEENGVWFEGNGRVVVDQSLISTV